MTRIVLLLAVALLATLGPKVAAVSAGAYSQGHDGSALLERVTALSSAPPVERQMRPRLRNFTGWAFEAEGCPAMVFPGLDQGDLDASAREILKNGEALAYVYEGEVLDQPPRIEHNIRLLTWHTLSAIGMGGRRPQPYALLIYSVDCDAPVRLDWAGAP